MTTYISLLRAINVGGHTITMEALRDHFTALGFTNVRSYIQTGNVFFDSRETNTKALSEQISKYLSEKLGYEVPAFVRTLEEYRYSLESAPFKGATPGENERFMVLSLSQALDPTIRFPISSDKGDYEILGATPTEAFAKVTLVNGKMGNPIAIEKMLGVKATSRFYHTALKILEAAQG